MSEKILNENDLNKVDGGAAYTGFKCTLCHENKDGHRWKATYYYLGDKVTTLVCDDCHEKYKNDNNYFNWVEVNI